MAVLAGAALALLYSTVRSSAALEPLDRQAQRYVSLGLAYAIVNEDALDFYYGPDDLEPDDQGLARNASTLRADLLDLHEDVTQGAPSERRSHLQQHLEHLLALIDVSSGAGAGSLDDEALRLYGLTIPQTDESAMSEARDRLAALLPGEGALAERVAAFQQGFLVPPQVRRQVFERALAECRDRTSTHWPLAAEEELEVEWTDAVDAAWHRYLGNGRSILQINPVAVAHLGSALDIACHETYPGHHAQFLASAEHGERIEDMLVFIQSPEQVLREGAAQYGVELALPAEQRQAFLRDTLFPIAGIDPALASRFVAVQAELTALSAASTSILQDYLDGRRTRFDAAYSLGREALVASPHALLSYVDDHRSYVLGYSVAGDLVEACVEARSARFDDEESARWQVLHTIVATKDLTALQGAACPPRLMHTQVHSQLQSKVPTAVPARRSNPI